MTGLVGWLIRWWLDGWLRRWGPRLRVLEGGKR